MNNQQLKEKGIKLTKHKIAILNLFNPNRHLDANQIYTLLQTQKINISLATIYRILTSFENNGILQKNNFNSDQSSYELKNPNEHHDHLICIACHKVIEFLNEKIESLQDEIAKANGFKIMHHSLNIYGKCSDCLYK